MERGESQGWRFEIFPDPDTNSILLHLTGTAKADMVSGGGAAYPNAKVNA